MFGGDLFDPEEDAQERFLEFFFRYELASPEEVEALGLLDKELDAALEEECSDEEQSPWLFLSEEELERQANIKYERAARMAAGEVEEIPLEDTEYCPF